MRVVVPRLDRNSVLWLQQEVLRDVVNDNRLVQVTTKEGQVLDVDLSARDGVVSIKPVCNTFLRNLATQVRQGPISVVLHACCEDHDLVILAHLDEELFSVGSDEDLLPSH